MAQALVISMVALLNAQFRGLCMPIFDTPNFWTRAASSIGWHQSSKTLLARIIFACIALLGGQSACYGNQITYYFGGIFQGVPPELSPTIVPGASFNGSFTFDSALAPTQDPDNPSASLAIYKPLASFALSVDGLQIANTQQSVGHVSVYNGGDDDTVGFAWFCGNGDVRSCPPAATINGHELEVVLLGIGGTVSALSSTVIPTYTDLLSVFADSDSENQGYYYAALQLYFDAWCDCDPPSIATFDISYVSRIDPNAPSSVSSPSTLYCIALALGGIYLRRRQG